MIRILRKTLLSRGDLFLPLLAGVWLLVVGTYAFVWTVDPYELRSARSGRRLADHAYPSTIVPRLVSVAASDGTDLVIVGASTALGYTPAMIRSNFPGSKRPVNLTYSCATAPDLAKILPILQTSKSLKRVIISLDFTLMEPCVSGKSPLDARYFGKVWYDPVPEYSLEAIELSTWIVKDHIVDLPAWHQRLPNRVDAVNFGGPLTLQPKAMAAIADKVQAQRTSITAGAPVSCDTIPALDKVIMPFVRRMAARGVAVDLLAPPYSLAFYYDNPMTSDAISGANMFQRLMAIRRCALRMSADIPGVRLHTFDTDLSVVGQLSHYKDVGHLREYEMYDLILRRVAAGDAILAPDQWPQFEADMKAGLKNFSPD